MAKLRLRSCTTGLSGSVCVGTEEPFEGVRATKEGLLVVLFRGVGIKSTKGWNCKNWQAMVGSKSGQDVQ